MVQKLKMTSSPITPSPRPNLPNFPSLDSDVVVPPNSNLQEGPAFSKSILQETEALDLLPDGSMNTNEVSTTTTITEASNLPKLHPLDPDKKVHPTSSLQEEPDFFKSSLRKHRTYREMVLQFQMKSPPPSLRPPTFLICLPCIHIQRFFQLPSLRKNLEQWLPNTPQVSPPSLPN